MSTASAQLDVGQHDQTIKPHHLACKYKKPALYLEYSVGGIGRLRRRKIPLHALYPIAAHSKPFPSTHTPAISSQSITEALIEKHHRYLQNVKFSQLERFVKNVLDRQLNERGASHTDEGTTVDGSYPNGATELDGVTDGKNLSPNDISTAPSRRHSNDSIGVVGRTVGDPEAILTYTAETDLNKLDDSTLSQVKNQMNTAFEMNRSLPTDPDFVYDKEVEFGEPIEISGWDDEEDDHAVEQRLQDSKDDSGYKREEHGLSEEAGTKHGTEVMKPLEEPIVISRWKKDGEDHEHSVLHRKGELGFKGGEEEMGEEATTKQGTKTGKVQDHEKADLSPESSGIMPIGSIPNDSDPQGLQVPPPSSLSSVFALPPLGSKLPRLARLSNEAPPKMASGSDICGKNALDNDALDVDEGEDLNIEDLFSDDESDEGQGGPDGIKSRNVDDSKVVEAKEGHTVDNQRSLSPTKSVSLYDEEEVEEIMEEEFPEYNAIDDNNEELNDNGMDNEEEYNVSFEETRASDNKYNFNDSAERMDNDEDDDDFFSQKLPTAPSWGPAKLSSSSLGDGGEAENVQITEKNNNEVADTLDENRTDTFESVIPISNPSSLTDNSPLNQLAKALPSSLSSLPMPSSLSAPRHLSDLPPLKAKLSPIGDIGRIPTKVDAQIGQAITPLKQELASKGISAQMADDVGIEFDDDEENRPGKDVMIRSDHEEVEEDIMEEKFDSGDVVFSDDDEFGKGW